MRFTGDKPECRCDTVAMHFFNTAGPVVPRNHDCVPPLERIDLDEFLQRIVNSGGRIEREYALGSLRTDLLILWPVGDAPGSAVKTVGECKCLHGSLERTIEQGLAQTRACMSRCAAGEGHLVIFDRTPGKPWEEKVFRREETADGAPFSIWGM